MKIKNIIFYSIIGSQILIALFAIRKWPLTDYHMFSIPQKKFHSLSRFYVEEVYADQTKTWDQQDYRSIGTHSPRLQFLIDNANHPDIERVLKFTVKNFSALKKQNPPQSIRLNKRTFTLQPDGSFVETKEFLREFNYAQLSE